MNMRTYERYAKLCHIMTVWLMYIFKAFLKILALLNKFVIMPMTLLLNLHLNLYSFHITLDLFFEGPKVICLRFHISMNIKFVSPGSTFMQLHVFLFSKRQQGWHNVYAWKSVHPLFTAFDILQSLIFCFQNVFRLYSSECCLLGCI